MGSAATWRRSRAQVNRRSCRISSRTAATIGGTGWDGLAPPIKLLRGNGYGLMVPSKARNSGKARVQKTAAIHTQIQTRTPTGKEMLITQNKLLVLLVVCLPYTSLFLAKNNEFPRRYCNDEEGWDYCDPNGSNSYDQDCMHMYADGKWNDVDCSLKTQAFFVEYGEPTDYSYSYH